MNLSRLVPSGFVYGVALALLPNVLVFTIPMPSSPELSSGGAHGQRQRIGGDAAAGVSTFRMIWPALALGAIATSSAFYLNLQEAPRLSAFEDCSGSQRSLQDGLAR